MSEVSIAQSLNASIIAQISTKVPRNMARKALEVGTLLALNFDNIDLDGTPEEIENSVVYTAPGVELTLGTILGWMINEGTDTVEDEVNDKLLLPYTGEKKTLHQFLKENEMGMPASIQVAERVFEAAGQKYLAGDAGPLRVQAYKNLGIETTGEEFPMVVPRNKEKDLNDVKNWTPVSRIIVTTPEA